MQSKRHSALETLTSTSIGFVGSWLIMFAVLRWLPMENATTSTVVTLLCTVWSLVRGYCLRRFFARRT